MKDYQMNHVQFDIEMKYVEDVDYQDLFQLVVLMKDEVELKINNINC
jgi:hypothetical protein